MTDHIPLIGGRDGEAVSHVGIWILQGRLTKMAAPAPPAPRSQARAQPPPHGATPITVARRTMRNRPPTSVFLTIEGIDGAGKSSHLESIRAHFVERGRTVVMTREPGGTTLAETLRTLILRDPMDPLTEVLLIFAARRDHLTQVIEPALARGDVVICDRFTDSTFAYQGHGRQFDLSVLATLEHWVQNAVRPDLTLWFDLSPQVAAQRLAGARAPDRFEAEQLAFFDRVRAGYAERAAAEPGRFRRIDASATREETAALVQATLAAWDSSRLRHGTRPDVD